MNNYLLVSEIFQFENDVLPSSLNRDKIGIEIKLAICRQKLHYLLLVFRLRRDGYTIPKLVWRL
jgi:hypothetical protein